MGSRRDLAGLGEWLEVVGAGEGKGNPGMMSRFLTWRNE